MPRVEVRGRPGWRRRTPLASALVATGWTLGLALTLAAWTVIAQQTMWVFVADAPEQAGNLLRRMVPPRWSYAPGLARPLWDTVNIATLGTLGALLLAVPVALLAARNTTPHPAFRAAALLVIVASRSIHSLVWALLMVYLIGPGVFAGTVAIAFRSIGFVAKLLHEAIEETDARQVEAVRASGAGPGQVMTFGIVPQVMPAFAGISVFRWDINVREATFLGLVGAGGIGLQLSAAINSLRWSQASVILLGIFVLVLFSEWASARIRAAIV